MIDLIGCEDPLTIIKKINALSSNVKETCSCKECSEPSKPIEITKAPIIYAEKSSRAKVDKAGYFVITPKGHSKISVEHYSYENKLLRVIEGCDAVSIYSTLVDKGWVTELSHAAYIGKELARAEMSLKSGVRYIQDSR